MKNTTKKLLTLLLASVFIVGGLTACSNSSDQKTEPTPTKDAASPTNQPTLADKEPSAQATVPPETDSYPVTITTYNYNGDEVETVYEKAPEKVLAVYQGSIETMLKLGLEDRIVAAAGLDNEVSPDMKAAFDKLNYLTEFTPSTETVLMLESDLILSWGSIFSDKRLGDVSNWIEKGTNTYINTNTRTSGSRTLENEYTDILNLGKIFQVEDKAKAIVDEMKDEIERVKTETATLSEKPNVLIVEFMSDSISNYGSATLGGDLVTSLGANLIKADGSNLGKETIITLDPDVIFVVYMAYSGDDPTTVMEESLNRILKDEAYSSLSAVKNNRIIPIMLGDMYASGVRTKDGIFNFAKGLYPNLYQ